MKVGPVIKILLVSIFCIFVGFELGLQRVFDSRSVVADAVCGADFLIVNVDGKPVSRIQHGMLITKVPLALLEPGEHILQVRESRHQEADGELIEFRVIIEKGVYYRITADEEGNPELSEKGD